MCSFGSRERRQLKAHLWRALTVLKRDKNGAVNMLAIPLMLVAMMIAIKVMIKPEMKQTFAADDIFITSSTPMLASNTFGEADALPISTNFNLTMCDSKRQFGVGLLKYGDNAKMNEVLDTVFSELNAAYKANVEGVGKELTSTDLPTEYALDAFI